MQLPLPIDKDSFQEAWIQVVSLLSANSWELSNLVVRIRDVTAMDEAVHQHVSEFASDAGLLPPKDVAYTIFPHGLYNREKTAERLCAAYNRHGGFYERVMAKKPGTWGTYFRRMTQYDTPSGPENQLRNIVDAIRGRSNVHRAAYTIVLQNPGSETIRPRGGPCLNYIAVQLSPNPQTLGLICVYRNHDFLRRAYGNYWGLCNLTSFLASETGFAPGPLTCVSSRAYASGRKRDLLILLEHLQ